MALHGEFAVLASVVTATSLFLATLVVSSDRFASVFLPGFVAYVVLFGLTLSSLPLGDDVDAVKRVLQILVAAAYALGAISLVVPLIGWLERRFTPRPAA